MSARLTVVYDGWSLIYAPNSAEALHLLTVLSCHPEGVQAKLVLPAAPPGWLNVQAEVEVIPTRNTERERLSWDLRARRGGAVLHLTSPNPPLFSRGLGLLSPAYCGDVPREKGMAARVRHALAQGARSRLGGLLWPTDLHAPPAPKKYNLPPVVHPAFARSGMAQQDEQVITAFGLPESYVLYHGPGDEAALQRLLSAWSWAAGSVGDYSPLIALGLDAAGRDRLSSLAFEMELSETIRSLPAVDIDELAAVYRRSRVLFHPACEPPWGGPVRNALACGLPVVSIDDDLINSLVGQAAYLVQADDTRLLGAALLTVLVEEEVAENLKGAAQQRAAGWSLPDYAQALAGVYQSILFSFQ